MTLRRESPKHACCGLTEPPSPASWMAPNTRFQRREGPFCSYFPCPVWRMPGCPFRMGLVILKAVPKPASECEELVEISHVPSPCAAHLRILSPSSIFGFAVFLFWLSCSPPAFFSLNRIFLSPVFFFSSLLFSSSLNSGPDRWTDSGHASKQSDSLRRLLAPGRTQRTTTIELFGF